MQGLPILLIQFLATLLFSFLVGLEYHSYRQEGGKQVGFGTTRTFTIVGMLGFALWVVDSLHVVFLGGLLALIVLLALYYWRRSAEGHYSLLHPLLVLLVYGIGPVSIELPSWFLVLYVVTLVLILGEKPGIRRLSQSFRSEEAATLAKFLIMAGVVLPLLPDRVIAPFIGVTYYQVWFAVIVVSGISYLSYLAQTYFFRERGFLLTGVLGGLYSSTAATVVLSKRAHNIGDRGAVSATIIVATVMMYLRLLVLVALLGHQKAAISLLLPFLLLVLLSLGVAGLLYRKRRQSGHPAPREAVRHPLELGTAVLFAVLFLAFAAITRYVTAHFGISGLHWLSFAVGFSDIDPFILSLLAGKYQVGEAEIISAVLIASGSNNLLKGMYALALDRSRTVLAAAIWLIALFGLSLAYVFLFL
ncbi:MAG TPA: DUF4010 domain-containing protein [Gammaproteobacteria bacterium]|nr:DUF4010 domain-containing protein [Gammaproteobacteria bacterium]